MKAQLRTDGGTNHHVQIDGLTVWVYPSDGQWVAHGIEVDYAASGRTIEDAQRAFLEGFSITLCEHLRRFHTVDKLLSRKAPAAIRRAWEREVERQTVSEFSRPLDVRKAKSPPAGMPKQVHFYQSTARAA